MKSVKLSDIYTAQGCINETIVNEKIENADFKIQIAQIKDDETLVWMLVDGNHSFIAAQKSENMDKIEIEIVSTEHKSLEDYVVSFNDLSNPVNIITGKDLW